MKVNPTKTFMMCLCTILPHVYCSGDFQCIGTCYSGRVTPDPQDTSHGKHLKGYSYKNITTDNPNKCYSSCAQDCRCKACQMQDARCELLEEDKSSKPSDFVAAPRYVYYDLTQTLYHEAYHMLPAAKKCFNGCCKTNPCINGGTCIEHCQDPKIKYTCECPTYMTEKTCEKPGSCLGILKLMIDSGMSPTDGVYDIFNNITETTLPLYCVFSKNTVWTLIESFSKTNNAKVCSKPFHVDAPFSDLSPPKWDLYRLSLDAMTYLRPKASLFRSTCNFPTRNNPSVRDFLVGSLNDVDITSKELSGGRCLKYLEIKIGDNVCTRDSTCTTTTYVHSTLHIYLDPSRLINQCTFHPPVQYSANYFACYQHHQTDASFLCSKSSDSTTQWWFGEEKDAVFDDKVGI